MTTDLLEREQFLLALDESLRQAAEGHGRTVLVSGEAGIGKTSLVERFVEQCATGTRVLWGACEALFAPRPLGPLYDIALHARTPLRNVLQSEANRATLFAAVLDEFAHDAAPAIMVVEDIHWGDEATLDLLKYLARRIHRTAALLILTYRTDEIDRDHPLRLVLGDLPARDVTRLRLPLLSEAAVAVLAEKADRPAKDLYLATGGNPFFISEVLVTDAPGVPTSVSDAVLAQVARRSPAAQRLLEQVSVVPNKSEWWLVEAAGTEHSAALDECLGAGILHVDGEAIGFRHELARQAVEDALAPGRRRALHAAVVRALLDRGVEQASLARLAHHATHAEDRELVLRFAPAAARQASAQGAHREATSHYAIALRYADRLDPKQRAELLDGLAQEHYLTGHHQEAVAPCEAALTLWQSLGETEKVAHDLRRLSRLSWFLSKNADCARYGMAAVKALETQPPGRELALAYSNMSQLHMLAGDANDALLWGRRAIALAEQLDDLETMTYALNNVGSAQLSVGDEQGRTKLERSLELALEHGHEEHVARAYANLAEMLVKRHEYAQAEHYIRDGMAYCAEHDLGSWRYCVRGHQARARLDQGDWAGAEEDAGIILSVPWASGTNRGPALIVLGYVRLRRGDPGAEAVLDEERDLALITGEVERIAVIAAARAEWSWLHGDHDRCVAEAEAGYQRALAHNYRLNVSELAIWLWRGGGLSAPPPDMRAPHALQIRGDWRAAADAWEKLGCPYEQALALMEGDEAALRTALDICERLGARPAAEMARRRLRAQGVRGLPRGPRPATRENPQGLTPRQLEILLLLGEGLHNAEIAQRLSTTPKTVDHHVSAVLAKLDARSRAEAVRIAYEVGLLPQMVTPHMGNIGM